MNLWYTLESTHQAHLWALFTLERHLITLAAEAKNANSRLVAPAQDTKLLLIEHEKDKNNYPVISSSDGSDEVSTMHRNYFREF